MKKLRFIFYCLLGTAMSCTTLQKPDKGFDVSIREPTFVTRFPKVLYDEAHLNTHKAAGTYKPFIDLITNDGCKVSINKETFSFEKLNNYDLLIICNAKSDKDQPRDIGAFTKEECAIVNRWVENGGSLLLIADHHPFGLANKALAQTFGVDMGCGAVKDITNKRQIGLLEFRFEDGLLKKHPVTTGYKAGEEINKVVTFTGQSLAGSNNATSLLTFGEGATEIRPDSIWVEDGQNYINFAAPVSVEGLSQAIAIEYHNGRVVILGEAAMLSAQKLFMRKFGMNSVKDADNRQLALNIIHWLAEKDHSSN